MIVPVSLFYIPFYTRRATLEKRIDRSKIEYQGLRRDRYIDLEYAEQLVCNELNWLPNVVFRNWIKKLMEYGLLLKGKYSIGEKKIIISTLYEELRKWYDNEVS